jgi:hypothetical protein
LVIHVSLQLCFNFLLICFFVHSFASHLVYSCVFCLFFVLVHLHFIFLLIYVLVSFENLCILHCDLIVFICKFRSSLFFIFYYILCCMFVMFLFVDLCVFNIDEVSIVEYLPSTSNIKISYSFYIHRILNI